MLQRSFSAAAIDVEKLSQAFPFTFCMSRINTDSANGVPPLSSHSWASKYGKMLETFFIATSANTQNLIPYLSGLLGINVIKAQ